MKSRVFQNKLELLEHLVEDGPEVDRELVRKQVVAAQRAYSRLRAAYLEKE
jgi:hypothetical protein